MGILIGDGKRQRILSPIRSKSLGDPCVVNVVAGFCASLAILFPDQAPSPSCIRRFGYSQPFDSVGSQVSVGNVGGLGMMQAGCDRSHFSIPLTQTYLPPSRAFIVGYICRFVTNRINNWIAILKKSC